MKNYYIQSGQYPDFNPPIIKEFINEFKNNFSCIHGEFTIPSQGARASRRERRSQSKGPERLIVSIEIETRCELLECGHQFQPIVSITKNMLPPKYRRCIFCINS